jgi:hypothetical protein
MRYVLILIFINTAFVGCNNLTPVQHDNLQAISPQKTEHQKSSQNKDVTSEAIVVFKKGTTIQDAKETIISASTNMPMLHIRSSLPTQKMMQLLSKNPKISSVSPDHVRHLDNI